MSVSHILWFWILSTGVFGGLCDTGKYTKEWVQKGDKDSTDHLNGVLFDNDQFLAYGRRTREISADGETWVTKGSVNNDNKFYGAAYGLDGAARKYVLVGGNAPHIYVGTVQAGDITFVDSDTKPWIAYAVAFGGGNFITGGPSVSYKNHGTYWDEWVQVNGPSVTNWNIYDIIYINNQFVGCGNGIYKNSGNGAWESEYQAEEGVTLSLSAVAYGNDKVVAVGKEGKYVTGTVGGSWAAGSIEGSGDLWGVAFGLNKFIAVNSNGVMYGSKDGIVWVLQTNIVSPPISLGSAASFNHIGNHLAYGKGVFVVVAEGENIYVAADNCACDACSECNSSNCNDAISCAWEGDSCKAAQESSTCLANECWSCPSAASCDAKGCTWDDGICKTPAGGSGGSVSSRPWVWFLMMCLSVIIFH